MGQRDRSDDGGRAAYPPPRAACVAWLLARQEGGAVLQNRTNALLGAIMIALLPTILVLLTLRPVAARATAADAGGALGVLMAIDLLVVGLLPVTLAVMAAGNAFAGEHEGGSLAPLLATPTANGAIFAGKILGALLPTLLFAAAAQLGYALAIAAFLGPARLRLMPPGVALAMLLLTPLVALFGIAVASVISSRVRTLQEAQQYGSLLLMPLWLGLIGLTAKLQSWGTPALFAAVAGLAVLDVTLVALGAATWRREEVMARR
jgi:ABC-type Na+ efflux pump permease subunit